MGQTTYSHIKDDFLPEVQGSVRFLETVADLFGAHPVDINCCRVLELGAGSGATMMFQAEEFPNSVFLGVDSSGSRVAEGKKMISNLGLTNVELRCSNPLEITRSWGKFDYIVMNGLFSRVPPPIQEKLLEICQNNLSPHGVALISFKTYPGWHAKDYVRNLMLLHTMQANSFESADLEIGQARAILNYMADSKRNQDSELGSMLRKIRDQIQNQTGQELYEEYLESENHPCYYLDFFRRLKNWGLDYLTDFHWTDRNVWLEDDEIRRLMDMTEPNEVSEQYLDFLVNRTSRSAMICHENMPKLPTARKDAIERYHFFLPKRIEITRSDDGRWIFQLPEISLKIGDCLLSGALVSYLKRLDKGYFSLQDIWGALLKNSGPNPSQYRLDELQIMLDRMVRLGILRIVLHPSQGKDAATGSPYARRFVRLLASTNRSTLPDSNFEPNTLAPLSSFIVSLLDGRHSAFDIVSDIQHELRDGRISIRIRDEDLSAENKDQIASLVNDSLEDLRRLRLIVN